MPNLIDTMSFSRIEQIKDEIAEYKDLYKKIIDGKNEIINILKSNIVNTTNIVDFPHDWIEKLIIDNSINTLSPFAINVYSIMIITHVSPLEKEKIRSFNVLLFKIQELRLYLINNMVEFDKYFNFRNDEESQKLSEKLINDNNFNNMFIEKLETFIFEIEDFLRDKILNDLLNIEVTKNSHFNNLKHYLKLRFDSIPVNVRPLNNKENIDCLSYETVIDLVKRLQTIRNLQNKKIKSIKIK